MGRDVRFIILNRDERFGQEVRTLLLQFPNVKILAEVDEPALLGQAVVQFPIDVVLVNLDPAPEAVLPVVREVTAAQPDLVIFATSQSTDGQLLLKVMRSGIREFLPKPIDGKTLGEAMQKFADRRVDAASHGKLVTVMGPAGGLGATVLATNLAVELAQMAEGKVAVVDLDYRFGQVATLLDVSPQFTLADLCTTNERLEPSVIERALVKHRTGVHVLSRPTNLAQAETLTAASCVGLLSTMLQLHEYVVTDGPSRFDLNAHAVRDLSDHALLVIQLLVPPVHSALRILDEQRSRGLTESRTKLICNRVGRTSAHLSPSDAAETLGLPIFASIADDWTSVSGAVNLGEPLLIHSPKSQARESIREIAERLHSPVDQTDDKDGRKKGLMDRIFAAN